MNHEILEKYLAGYATDSEKQQIVAWVSSSPTHRKTLQTLRKLYDTTLWCAAPKQRAHRWHWVAAAAVLLALLVGGWYQAYRLGRNQPLTALQTIRVPAGQRVEVELADGTTVWLNAGTTFTFPNHFSTQNREVTLNGEAYFNVHKETDRPFLVKTNQYTIQVFGTEFNVLAYNHSSLFEVSLLSGSIEVSGGSQVVRPEPLTRLYQSGGQLLAEKIHDFDYLMWKEGLICFDDATVDQMVSKLELYFDTEVIVRNEAFKKKRYTGKFRTKDGIEHVLRVFQLKDAFTYEKDDEKNQITIR